ncbi:Tripartite motif-containing protein 2 [Holothuria leucospilota]|uniref:Tripartite motif-containing protein 2 n=1 Tax=Holothuria leucospilota TaxID=206669 RepID=A0A9Q1HGY1_HOLLE|nr:Tripartite motif-containing protein 2 [Holothuria leucospilota]
MTSSSDARPKQYRVSSAASSHNIRISGSSSPQISCCVSCSCSTSSQSSSNTRHASSKFSQTGRPSDNGDNQDPDKGDRQQSIAAKKYLHAGRVVKGVRENLLCPICLDLFENAKNLPCGHAVCEECIGQWVTSKGGELTCPTCKERHSLPLNGVVGLATNFALNNLVTELKILDQEGLVSEVSDDKEQLPRTSTLGEETIESLVEKHAAIPQPRLSGQEAGIRLPAPWSGVPLAENSFLEKTTKKNFEDAKGSKTRMRVQLCDSDGTHLCGRRCDKVEATVLSPTNEKEKVSVSLMKRDGDYSFSFIPNKVGVHLVEAYLDGVPIRGSPLKILVHPSAKLDTTIVTPMHDPLDVVVHEGMIYATDDSKGGYLRTDWKGNWSYPSEDWFNEAVDSFGIDASNNRFYVTDPNKSCVFVYDVFGDCKNTFGKRVLKHPTGIAVSRERMIYVADSKLNTIEVFRPNFSHMSYMIAGGNADHCSLALLALNPAEDRLIAADEGTDCFKIFDVVKMKMVKMIKTRVQQAPAKPVGVAVDEDGNILVSVTFDPSRQRNTGGHNRRKGKKSAGAIITYNSEGYFLGKFGEDQLREPNGLCIAEDKVVVVDQGTRVRHCLQVYKL